MRCQSLSHSSGWAKNDEAVRGGVPLKRWGAQEDTAPAAEVIKSASVCGVLAEVMPVKCHISSLSDYVTVTLTSEFTLLIIADS